MCFGLSCALDVCSVHQISQTQAHLIKKLRHVTFISSLQKLLLFSSKKTKPMYIERHRPLWPPHLLGVIKCFISSLLTTNIVRNYEVWSKNSKADQTRFSFQHSSLYSPHTSFVSVAVLGSYWWRNFHPKPNNHLMWAESASKNVWFPTCDVFKPICFSSCVRRYDRQPPSRNFHYAKFLVQNILISHTGYLNSIGYFIYHQIPVILHCVVNMINVFLYGGTCKASRPWVIFKTLPSLPKFSFLRLLCW